MADKFPPAKGPKVPPMQPYGYLREKDGQIQISIGPERPHNRSGGYATPWFAIYTTPQAPIASFYRDGIEAAAKWVDQQREAYDSEHGWSDPDTGSFEFGNDAQRDYSDTLAEIAEGIRSLHPNAGNPPVIPEGYVLVPIEPTEDMIVEGFESEPDEDFSDPAVWEEYQAMSGCQQAAHRAKLCWSAMIAAAPKPGDSNG